MYKVARYVILFSDIKGVKKVRSAIKLEFFYFSNFVLNDINDSESN